MQHKPLPLLLILARIFSSISIAMLHEAAGKIRISPQMNVRIARIHSSVSRSAFPAAAATGLGSYKATTIISAIGIMELMSINFASGRTQYIVLLSRSMHITKASKLFRHSCFARNSTYPREYILAFSIALQQVHEATAFRKARHTA